MNFSKKIGKHTFNSIVTFLLTASVLYSTVAGMYGVFADETGTAVNQEKESYNAYTAVKAQQSAGSPGDWRVYNDTNWIYEEKNAEGIWSTPSELKKGNNMWGVPGEIQTALPDMYYYWNFSAGRYLSFATNGGRVIMSCQDNSDVTPALTFIVPKTGTINLYDPAGGDFGAASVQAPFWTLNNPNEKIGVAIYKNDEKIWPENNAAGVEDGLFILSHEGKQTIAFPEITDLKVTTGDRIRILFEPLKNDYGYVALAPQVDYTQTAPSYSAAQSVAEMCNAGNVSKDSAWIYTPKNVKFNPESGMYEPIGDWLNPELAIGRSDNESVNAFLQKQMNIPGKQNGLATADGKVYTFVGNGTGYAPAVTFNAPLSGTIKMSDPMGVGIGSAGTGNPFWTLHEPKKVGVVIYKNDEKIWPADKEYYVLNGNDWSSGSLVEGNICVNFPELGEMRVEKGDNVRIMMIPLTLDWGYFALSPTVDYTDVDAVQPEIKEDIKYSGEKAVDDAIDNGGFNGTDWYLECKACYANESAENLPDGKWVKPTLVPGEMTDNAINNLVPNWLKVNGTTIGVSSYNKAVLLSTGSSGVNLAVSLTFEAPKSGKIDLNDPAGGSFGTASIANPFWTLNESTKVAGLVIYKNDEKLWPQDKEYYRLQGQWDADIGGYNYDYEPSTLFPSLKNIEIKAGDKLRMVVIPIKNTWHYIRLAPQVNYREIDMDSQKPTVTDEEKPLATYRANDALKKAISDKNCENSVWKLQGIFNEESDAAFPPLELGRIINDGMYIYKPFNYNGTTFGIESCNLANTSLSVGVDMSGKLLLPACSNAEHIGRISPTLTFTAPKTGVIRLHGDDFNPGIVGCSQYGPYYTMQKTFDPDESTTIRMFIYKNNKQIWPAGKDDNVLTTNRRNMKFPDINLQVYKGDSIRLIFDTTGGWEFVKISPIVDYLHYNIKVRPSDDNPVWSYGKKTDSEIVWEDFDFTTDDSDGNIISNETNNITENNDFVAEDEKPTVTSGKKIKKIIRKKLRKNGGSNATLAVVLSTIGILLIVGGTVTFFYFRKKFTRRRES